MQPTTASDFLRVARQRLDVAAEIMHYLRRNLEAQYIGGYSVECSLKSLILEKTPSESLDQTLQRLTRGAHCHRPEVLLGRLRDLGVSLNLRLARRMRRFDWTTDLRYEIGRRDTGETKALLKTAEEIYLWVESQIT
jgi:hypothetical protein